MKAINILTAGFKCCKSLWKEPRKPHNGSSSAKEGWGSGWQRWGETYISLYILLHLLDFVNVLIYYFYFKIWNSKDVTLPFQSEECLHLIETGENLAKHQSTAFWPPRFWTPPSSVCLPWPGWQNLWAILTFLYFLLFFKLSDSFPSCTCHDIMLHFNVRS